MIEKMVLYSTETLKMVADWLVATPAMMLFLVFSLMLFTVSIFRSLTR